MKIAYVIDHLRADGTQRFLTQLTRGLALRHSQTVYCLNNSYDVETVRALHQAGAATRVIGRGNLASGIGLAELGSALAREKYDVVVTMLFASDVVGRTLAHCAKVPRIVTSLRARNVVYAPWQRWLVRRTMRWADLVVLNSVHVREFAVREEGAPRDRIIIIPNGVEPACCVPPTARQAIRREFGIASGNWLIGAVGRLDRQKGFDVLLEALPRIGAEVELVLIGDGSERAALERQGRRLGIADRVHFAGYRRDVATILNALDLYVQPSRFEGMPNALLEAMAAGRPVVASQVDGICEVVEDGSSGWLVPPDDAEALGAACRQALDEPGEALRRGQNACKRAMARFTVSAMVEAWENVIGNV